MALNSKQQMFWTNEKRKLSDLKPWQRNPRQIKDKQAKLLAESFSDFGQVETIAISANGDIYNGHQRLSVLAGKYGMDYEVDVRVSSRDLTEKERERLTVYLHRGATGEWSWDELANWDMSDLLTWGFEESDFPFDVAPATNEGADAEPQIDKAEELRVKWNVQSGQMWQLGEHRIICGDCTDRAVVERVMGGEKARYGIQDPPYGISVVGGSKSFGSVGGSKSFGSVVGSNIVRANKYSPIVDDDKPYDPSYILSICPDTVLWGANYYSDKLPPKKGWIVWDKKGKDWDDNFSDCELAWTPFDKVTKIYRYLWMGIVQEGNREARMHPTQKPAGLYERIITDLFVDGGCIIDFYLGSGTTLIACENLSRKCRSVEISPAYVAVAIQRWVDVTGKEPILLDA